MWKQPKLNPISKELDCLTYLIAVIYTSPVTKPKIALDEFITSMEDALHKERTKKYKLNEHVNQRYTIKYTKKLQSNAYCKSRMYFVFDKKTHQIASF